MKGPATQGAARSNRDSLSRCARIVDQQQAHPKVDQRKVDAAIEKGAAYLLGRVERGLPSVNHPHGGTFGLEELVLYTLIHAGVDRTDKRFQQLVDRVVERLPERTYTAALRAMALEALDAEKYQKHIAQCGQFLVDNQCENGQWGYGEKVELPPADPPPKDVATQGGKTDPPKTGRGTKAQKRVPVKRRQKGPPSGDNSNSQYAALGIRACLQAGIEIPRATLVDALKWWEKSQNSDGGWGYNMQGTQGEPSYASMTAGAVGACVIYRYFLKLDFKKDPKVLAGFKWMDDNFSVTENPKYPQPKMWHYYWVYAIERAGILYGTESFGRHEWYPEGAHWLLDNQKADGSWDGGGSLGGVEADTCFAILFLRRATKPLPGVKTEGPRKR